jgi:hypothetical protein
MVARGHGASFFAMHAGLEAGAQRASGNVDDMGLRGAQQSGVVGIVAVGFEQRGAARTERAVDIEFDRAN